MRGKRSKERENYMLRMMDGALVEVTRELYGRMLELRSEEWF